MTRTLLRAFLALVLVWTLGVQSASAQCSPTGAFCPPPNNPSRPDNNNNNAVWYVVGGIAAVAIGGFIASRLFPTPERGLPPQQPPGDPSTGFPGGGLPAAGLPSTGTGSPSRGSPSTGLPSRSSPGGGFQSSPPITPVNLPPPGGGGIGPAGGGAGAPKAGTPKTTPTALRRGFNVPPPGETRFVPDEVILDVPPNVSEAQLNAIAARHSMTRMETRTFGLTGRRLFRWRLDGGGDVADMIRSVARETQVAGAQPNYLYALAEGQLAAQEQLPPMNADQYAPERLHLLEAHKLATGSRVLVAVIDSGIDASHPDLAGAVVKSFDAVEAAGGNGTSHAHGTGMAGAIAARRAVLGTAPRVGVLAVRAFDPRALNGEGTTFNIIKGIDWAVENGARVINMSFAGPADPRLSDVLARASKRGIVLVAAAGNAGPNSPPLYPAADRNVIAVTATDIDDKLYTGANRGNHIAMAAPGVNVLVPAPGGIYQFTTGTSVAAAHVSGVAALLLERNPRLTPTEVRRILTRTARSLGPRERARDFGAGLVNAFQAVSTTQR
jgi:hypothetical protein